MELRTCEIRVRDARFGDPRNGEQIWQQRWKMVCANCCKSQCSVIKIPTCLLPFVRVRIMIFFFFWWWWFSFLYSYYYEWPIFKTLLLYVSWILKLLYRLCTGLISQEYTSYLKRHGLLSLLSVLLKENQQKLLGALTISAKKKRKSHIYFNVLSPIHHYAGKCQK